MKIPSANAIGNGYFNYGDSYILDNVNSETSNDDSDMDGEFSEYLWMENEEEFDKEVMQQLEEEALMEQCIEAMLEDELSSQEASMWASNNANNTSSNTTSNNTTNNSDIASQLRNMKIDEEEIVKSSKLNPLAAEFVPNFMPQRSPQNSITAASPAKHSS